MDPRDLPTAHGKLRPSTQDPALTSQPGEGASDTVAAVPPVAPVSAIASTGDVVDPLIGTTVASRYRLLAKLGQGGMGTVYRGEHLSLKKRVAVKFLHREMSSNQELVTRFEREAVAAANLDHPNVVAATDFGRLDDGTFFLVMEYVEGRSLRKVLEEGRPNPRRVVKILRQVGAALSRAHGLGIVHRDLKPENIVVVDREGERDLVKVIDFGIARLTGPAFAANNAPALTQVGTVFGTPEYMAPEQAMGQPVDGAADQYSLGIIAFELFTGRRPFHANDPVDVLRMHVGAPIPSLLAHAPELPPSLDPIVARMMAKLPDQRFPSVAAAIEALESAVGPSSLRPSAEPAIPSTVSRSALAIPESAATPEALIFRGAFGARWILIAVLALSTLGLVAYFGFVRSPAAREVNSTANQAQTIMSQMAVYQEQPDVARALSRSVRGDLDGAVGPLRARLQHNASDGFAAYFLATTYWSARHNAEALENFRLALSAEPALADDAMLTRAIVSALNDSTVASSALAMLQSAPLNRSSVAARAVADEAIDGASPQSHQAAMTLAQQMDSLLLPLQRARISLRDASNCEQLRVAMGALESLDESGLEESRMVRAGACDMLRIGDNCRACFEDRTHGRGR